MWMADLVCDDIPPWLAGCVAVVILALGCYDVAAPKWVSGSFSLKLLSLGAGVRTLTRLVAIRGAILGLVLLALMLAAGGSLVGMVLLVLAIIPFGDMAVVLGADSRKSTARIWSRSVVHRGVGGSVLFC